MAGLAVKIDQVAALRNARKSQSPDPVTAATMAELAGADGIIVHLRLDRKHINDRDLRILRSVIQTKLILEMASTSEMVGVALDIKPDLVILDVLMPRQSGVRLYRELKTSKSLKDVRVIILSGIAKKTFLRSQKALTEFGGAEVPEPEIYLEKPVEPEELAEVINKVLA